jgi:5'-3' exonuclease
MELYSGPVQPFEDAELVLLFDCNNMIFRGAKGVVPRHIDLGDFQHRERRQTAHLQGFHHLVARAWQEHGEPFKTALVFGFDGRGAKATRQEIYPAYKVHPDKPDHFLETLGIPKRQALDDLRGLCSVLPGNLLEREGAEFDDMAYSVIARHPKRYVVFSTDRDMWALIGRFPGVSVVGQTLVRPSDLTEKFGLLSFRHVATFKVLFGDPSDNIPSLLPRLRKRPVVEFLNRLDDPEALPVAHFLARFHAEVEAARKFIDAPGFRESFYRNQALVWFHWYEPTIDRFTPGDARALAALDLQLGAVPWF